MDFSFYGYNVPLIPSGLRHEETIIQTANALEYLNNTINDIFDKIDDRINRNNMKINEIQKRIENTNEKIKSLVGTKKAICIYSPAKFPANHILQDIPSTFAEGYYKNIEFELKYDYEVQSDLDKPLTQSSLQDKLEFFYVREVPKPSRITEIQRSTSTLGPIPSNLKSINSLLLFNTIQNVYATDKEQKIFKSQPQPRPTEDKNETQKTKIEAPPISITSRQLGTEKRKIQQKLFYTPTLNDAPDINLPLDLPDLPGVADNIHFDIMKKDKIAPSLFVEDDVINPVITEDISVTKIDSDTFGVFNIKPTTTTVEIGTTTTDAVANITTTTVLPPVPPPPPPPISVILGNDQPTQEPKKSHSTKIPELSDARSNLMEAIRKAGGARGGKLRAAADVISEKASNKSKNSTETPISLMDDLHRKLQMRRKGISGSKENDKSISIFDRLSSIIAPPPKPTEDISSSASSDNDNDTDWD